MHRAEVFDSIDGEPTVDMLRRGVAFCQVELLRRHTRAETRSAVVGGDQTPKNGGTAQVAGIQENEARKGQSRSVWAPGPKGSSGAMKVGFVGLGNMGGPMAANLLKAGYSLTVFDVVPSAVQQLAQQGATAASTPCQVASSSDVVLTSLPTPPIVEAVYLGQDGLLEGARSGQVFIDLSSVTPSLSRKLAGVFSEKGAKVLDAPVSGGTSGAKAGTLSIMVGGEREAAERVDAILKTIGEKIFYIGPIGSGGTMKIVNQLLVGINALAAVEALALVNRSGLDPDLVNEVVSASAGFSKGFQTRFPKGLKRDYSPGFAVDLMAKDLRLVRDLAAELGVELALTPKALSVFEATGSLGFGKQDIVSALESYDPSSR